MSLWFGLWTVIALDPTRKLWVCRCVCGAVLEVERATPDESLVCGSCGYRPFPLRQLDEQRAEQAWQFTFGW
jgi:hypothetical protein